MTTREAIERFQTVHGIDYELKRIAPIKKGHRTWAAWGNVEHMESYKRLLAYEEVLKRAKAVIEYMNEQ